MIEQTGTCTLGRQDLVILPFLIDLASLITAHFSSIVLNNLFRLKWINVLRPWGARNMKKGNGVKCFNV